MDREYKEIQKRKKLEEQKAKERKELEKQKYGIVSHYAPLLGYIIWRRATDDSSSIPLPCRCASGLCFC